MRRKAANPEWTQILELADRAIKIVIVTVFQMLKKVRNM